MKRKNLCCALAAASLLVLGSAFTASAAEWQSVDGEWVYVENSGDHARDVWKTDTNGKQYYLGSDGFMVRNSLIEYNGGYYYVNSAGEMLVNEWRFLEDPAWVGESEDGESAHWFYFGSNGRAAATTGSSVQITTIGDKRYAFDNYGRMVTGWISESGEALPDSEWANAMYYGDGEGSGNIVTNSWVLINVPDDDNEEDAEPMYHFFFGSNGKKTVNTDKTVGDKKYHFDERGVSVYGWLQTEDETWRYYGPSDDPYLRTGWFEAVPDENLNGDGHEDGSQYWYYASARGDIAMSEFKTVGSKSFAFNSRGEMITGLKKISFSEDDHKTITGVASIDTVDDLSFDSDESAGVFYFASGDGAIKTGTQTIEVDGTSYTFNFKSNGSPKGAGVNGISSNHIYVNGRCLTAESGTKYQTVSYGDATYLVNESGVIQKGKKNVKDQDGYYYCANSDGTLLHGPLSDKCTEH